MIDPPRRPNRLQQTFLAALLALALGLSEASAAQPAAAAAPQHGGGGFALLLLDYRMALERLTEDLRERAAELAAGADMLPGEISGALQRVTAGADPVFLVAGLLGSACSPGGLSAGDLPATSRRFHSTTPRPLAAGSGAPSIGRWSICSGSAPSPCWRSASSRFSCRRPDPCAPSC
jgi:hypothetical protein